MASQSGNKFVNIKLERCFNHILGSQGMMRQFSNLDRQIINRWIENEIDRQNIKQLYKIRELYTMDIL